MLFCICVFCYVIKFILYVCFLLLYIIVYIPMYILSSSDLSCFVCLSVVYLHVYYCNKFEVWCLYLPHTCIPSSHIKKIKYDQIDMQRGLDALMDWGFLVLVH